MLFTEIQNSWGWKGGRPLQPPHQAGSPRAACPGLFPVGFGAFSLMETPQPTWVTSTSVLPSSQFFCCCFFCLFVCYLFVFKKFFFLLCSDRISCVSVFASCPVSGHCWDEFGSFFVPSHRVFIHTDKTPPKPTQGQQTTELQNKDIPFKNDTMKAVLFKGW